MEEWGFFYLSQSGMTHSLSWWCRNTVRMEKSHKLKWKGFLVFSCLHTWLFFHSWETNIIWENLKLTWKKIHWSSNFTPVCRCSAEISHIHWQVTYTEIIEVLWHIWDAFMPLCQDCAHNSEQLAVCKGSRKTTVAIFTWRGREVSLPVSGNYSNKTFTRRALYDSTTVEVVMSNVNTVNENVIWLMSSRETQIKLK